MSMKCGWCITGHCSGCPGTLSRYQGSTERYPCTCESEIHSKPQNED